MIISIDIANNEICSGGVRAIGRHRWEALFLAALVQKHGQPLRRVEFDTALRQKGQMRPLDRTGMSRLLTGLTLMLDALLGAGVARRRITHAPRTRTVGPWTWVVEPAESWGLLGDETAGIGEHRFAGGDSSASGSPAVSPLLDLPAEIGAGPQIALTGCRASVLTCLEKLLKSDAMAYAGHLEGAIELLQDVAQVENLTMEMRGIVDLRRITLLRRSGRYDDANDLASTLLERSKAKGARPTDPALGCLARLALICSHYGRTPHAYARVAQDLAGISIPAAPDVRASSQQQILWALLSRRYAMAAIRDGRSEEAVALLQRAWRHANTAMYWALSQRDNENCQNYAFNMGLVLRSQFDAGDGTALEFAFRYFRLTVQCADDFLCGNDSVWDFIVLGDLWLEYPDQRAVFDQGLAFGQSGPHAQLFYEEGLRRAKAIGDARQISLCVINLWRWGESLGADPLGARLQHRARRELCQVLDGNDGLMRTLRGDDPAVMDKIVGPEVVTVPKRRNATGHSPRAPGKRAR